MSMADVEPRSDTMPLRDLERTGDEVARAADGTWTLVGSVCGSCGDRCFPQRLICSSCASHDLRPLVLAGRGSLYSYTTVHVSSARPTPYTLGYVDLREGPRLLTLVEPHDAPLRIDQPVRLVVHADGTWSFTPEDTIEDGRRGGT